MNTHQKGQVRYIVFKEKNTWYAAGLEFNIVESGENAREGYVDACRKVKGSRLAPLNQIPDPEYIKLWNILTAPKKIKSPFEISTFGVVKV